VRKKVRAEPSFSNSREALVCVCVFFPPPVCAFPLKFLQGSRDHESLGRENWQTSTEIFFKVSLREREVVLWLHNTCWSF
jgi:hypothetical protein